MGLLFAWILTKLRYAVNYYIILGCFTICGNFNMISLITGANGFIGQHLCEYLSNQGIKVRGTVRDINSVKNNKIELHATADINGDTNWTSLLEGVDIVYHLAGTVHRPSITDPQVYRESIELATEKLAKQAEQAGVKRFIYFSSLHVYGIDADHNIITESTPKNPRTPYGRAKLAAENKLQDIASLKNMDVIIIRPPLVYGRGVKGNFSQLIRLVRHLPILPFGCAKQKRSFIGVDNLINFAHICSYHSNAINKIFNISDDNDLNTKELSIKLAKLLNVNQLMLPIPRNIMKLALKLLGKQELYNKLFESVRLDISSAKNMLNWTPRFTVDEQLLKTIS